MPAKSVVSIEGNLRNYGLTAMDLAEERDALSPERMAEMLYEGFEDNVSKLESERGIYLPPPTDMSGNIMPGYAPQHQMQRAAASGQGGYRQGGFAPVSANEGAISTLMEAREDALKRYSSCSQDVASSVREAMSIQKLEAQIISLGGEIERFDPAKYRSGLKPVEQSIDKMGMANKVVGNTKAAYTLLPIESIHAGANKSGEIGLAIKIACGNGAYVRGSIIPKTAAFSGSEVIDFVPDDNGGRMTVKAPKGGYWEDVSSDYRIGWKAE